MLGIKVVAECIACDSRVFVLWTLMLLVTVAGEDQSVGCRGH